MNIRFFVAKINHFFSRKKTNIDKSIIIIGFILGIIFGSIVYPILVDALTKTFIQSDWSGGTDTITTINDDSLTGWTKFYSKTTGINSSSSGEIKLNIEISQP